MITDPTGIGIGELHHRRDERTAQAGVALPVAGLYPSLHLNLTDLTQQLTAQ